MSWLWDDRLAEVWASPDRAGSGVAIGDRSVLTARHVVAQAVHQSPPGRVLARIVLRNEAVTSWVPMRIVADDLDWDLAVLTVDLDAPEAGEWVTPVSSSPVLAAMGTAVEHGCEAVGFPDQEVQYERVRGRAAGIRQSEQASGSVKPMGQAKTPVSMGRPLPRRWMPFDVQFTNPRTQAGWGGMSGAGVVLPDGRLAAVVVAAQEEHQQRRLLVVALAEALAASRRLNDALAWATGSPVSVEPRHPQRVPISRSAYLPQVRRIAPQTLDDREAELAELATFCTAPDQGPYLWWRAPAWSGKSALLSWFVLHPPPGVQLVAFFITARFAGQDNRIAFTDVVLEQLADLLGDSVPAFLTEATRDGHLLRLLDEAAALAAARGDRLVLIVDGLDEDRGVTAGPMSHSIAALLPTHPSHGLRIIVSGRPHPLPGDVSDDHPLRDPGIVTWLEPSDRAQVVRADAESELKRMLKGTSTERDVLGLITAAAGGLSGTDLAELTGLSPWEVEDHLHAVSGRSFIGRTGRWRPDTEVYVLGHENLQVQALALLGPTDLRDYRRRLKDWAQEYRSRRWPPETPEYLLRGYVRMLSATGDLDELVACATDSSRHDRMLDLTNGDSEAIGEITATMDQLVIEAEPDLAAIGRLAFHRDALQRRNTNISADLVSAWVELGQHARAEAMARSITDAADRDRALAVIAQARAARGDGEDALSVTDSIRDQQCRFTTMVEVVRALAESGDLRAASSTARTLTPSEVRACGLGTIARAAADAGQWEECGRLRTEAEAAVQEISDPKDRLWTQAMIAMTIADDPARTLSLLRQLLDWARSQREQLERMSALGTITAASVESGDSEWALSVARSIADDTLIQCHVLQGIASAAAVAGDFDHAEAAVHAIPRPEYAASAWAHASIVAFGAGVADRARQFAEQAQQVAESLPPGHSLRSSALGWAAYAWAELGDAEVAGRLAGAAEDAAVALIDDIAEAGHEGQGWALPDGVAILAKVDLDRALTVAAAIPHPGERSRALAAVALAAVDVGERTRARALAERAETVARSITDVGWQVDTLTAAAVASAGVGEATRALRLTESAESAVRSGIGPRERDLALIEVAVALGHQDLERAAAVVVSIANQDAKRTAMYRLLAVAADRGDVNGILPIASSLWETYYLDWRLGDIAAHTSNTDLALALADSFDDRYLRVKTLRNVAHRLADSGDLTRAETVATSIDHPIMRAPALIDVARAAGSQGDPTRARSLAERAEADIRLLPDSYHPNSELLDVARLRIGLGDVERAGRLIQEVEKSAIGTEGSTPDIDTLLTIAPIVADSHDIDRARVLVEWIIDLSGKLADPVRRLKVRARVSRLTAEIGDRERAHRFAAEVAMEAEAVMSLPAAIEIHDDAGRSTDHRYEPVVTLAGVLAGLGDLDRALSLAQATGNDHISGSAAIEMVRVLARKGDIDTAETSARAISDDPYRDSALREVVTVLASRGELERAAALAQEFSSPGNHHGLWSGVVGKTGVRNERRQLAYALQLDDWRDCLPHVVRVDPSAITTIADDVLHLLTNQPSRRARTLRGEG
ncbi:MAG: trypsin-like peptidase domain-containing protein [Actinoplanes sp.]